LKNIISILVFILVVISSANAQSFTYSYTDPCTCIRKNIAVASSGVTVSYYGQVTTFAPSDFYNGAFETWTNNVYNSFGGINPCASVVGMPTATSVAQSTAINFIGQVNSLSALADLSSSLGAVGSTDILGGVTGSASNSSIGGDNNGNSNNNNNTSNGNNSNSSTTNSNGNINSSSSSNGKDQSNESQGGSSGSSKTDEGTNGSSGSGGNTTGEESPTGSTEGTATSGDSGVGNSSGDIGNDGTGSSTTETSSSEGGGKTNILGGSVGSVGGSSGSSSGGSGNNKEASSTAKNGNRPSILASSDFVGFNFKNSDIAFGGKVTGGYTAMRWDGKRANGITADYTSALKGPNVTGFYANITKKRIDLISGILTVGFDRQMSVKGNVVFVQ